MRVFVDFDGVLRCDAAPPQQLEARCVAHFAQAVLGHPDAKVVIVSAWRLAHPLQALRALFPAALAERIEGVTPELPVGKAYLRRAEVLAYLQNDGRFGSAWIAVDDKPVLYGPDANVIAVDPAVGFDARCASELRQWLLRG